MSYGYGKSPATIQRERIERVEQQTRQDRARAEESLKRTRAMIAEARAMEEEAEQLQRELKLDRVERERLLRTLARAADAESARRWALLRFREDPQVGWERLEDATAEMYEVTAGERGRLPLLTVEQKRRIAAEYRRGRTQQSLADEYGVSISWLRKAALHPNRHGVSVTPERHLSGVVNPLVGVSPVRDVPRPSQGHAA